MTTVAAQKVYAPLPHFDPLEGTTILAPEGDGSGFWVGAPTVMYDADRQSFLMTYRRRRPRGMGSDRGYEAWVAESKDGVHFTNIWSVKKEQLGTTSMEKFCLARTAAGGYLLYVSYVDSADNRWRIDVMEAATPDGFDPAEAVNVFTGASTGTEGVKDPYVVRVGGAYYMIISFARSRPLSASEQAVAHATADIYNTGVTTCPTALAVSNDGIHFKWLGEVLSTGEGWDKYQARINSIMYVAPVWVGFYDGSSSEKENYEERCGIALSFDLLHWERITTDGPWVVAPHASGSCRYLDAVPMENELYYYYEYVRPDGAHELRLNRVPRQG